ncbi:hypothetical protein TARUN_1406, partial [Trichoderma arundinaceum]
MAFHPVNTFQAPSSQHLPLRDHLQRILPPPHRRNQHLHPPIHPRIQPPTRLLRPDPLPLAHLLHGIDHLLPHADVVARVLDLAQAARAPPGAVLALEAFDGRVAPRAVLVFPPDVEDGAAHAVEAEAAGWRAGGV